MDGEGGRRGEAFSVYEEDSHSGCSALYCMPPTSQLLKSWASCVRRPCGDGEPQGVGNTLTQSKVTPKKTKQFHSLLLHSKAQTHRFGNAFVGRL